MKQSIAAFIDRTKDVWIRTSRTIWENPELGHEEFLAARLLTGILEEYGFEVERGCLGLATAFRATYRSGKPGPRIGYMAEYDALPELGHGCGHNLIGVMSVAAAISLRETADQHGGEIIVYGTPAEETSGAKVTMAEHGYFDELAAAMMAHPSRYYERSGRSLALTAVQFDYYGKAAHAAASPQEGINALDAVIQLFNSVNALRQQTTRDARIHGIITKGGSAPNIIPDHTQTQFYVRTGSKSTLEELKARVVRCAEAAAIATGCRLEQSHFSLGYDNLVTNEALSQAFIDNLHLLGVEPGEVKHGLDHGSLDMGNVSHRAPAIHPYIRVPDMPYGGHTTGFRDACGDDRGMTALLMGAKALAWSGFDLLTNPSLVQSIQDEFRKENDR